MLRPIYDWMMRLAGSRHAPWALAVISFTESSFFPLPPDVMLAPMVLARRDRAYLYAALCTVASVLGGLLGYAIGYYLEPVGTAILGFFGHPQGQAEFQAWFAKWGPWVILIKGLTPIPYKLVTIASGLAHYPLLAFTVLSAVTRGGRFFLTAWLIKRFGKAIQEQVEKRLALTTFLVLGILIGAYLLVRVLG